MIRLKRENEGWLNLKLLKGVGPNRWAGKCQNLWALIGREHGVFEMSGR